VTINKLRMNEQLTPLDLQELERLLFQNPSLGGREQFEKAYGRQDSLGLFIRGLVGLDREAAKKLFAEFLTGTRYSADQIRFVNFIIDRLTQRGVMQPEQLYEPPCTDLSPAGIDGVFKDADAERIIKLLRQVEESARPAMAAGG
jgi:type I restriction enzyme R subunit